jgi:hypothetical protein
MKLYARTPTGVGLYLHIWLTGQMQEFGGEIRCVEVTLPPGSAIADGYNEEGLPKPPAGDLGIEDCGRRVLWADPTDFRADDGGALKPDELRAKIQRVNDRRAKEMRRGPLGENWP